MHKSQVFFWLLVSFLLGIFIAFVFDVGQVFIYVGFAIAIGFVAIFGYQKSFNQKGFLAGFLLVVFLFGIARFNSANLRQDALDVFVDLKAGEKGVEVTVNGYIDDEVVVKGNKLEIVLRAKEVVTGDRIVRVDDRIMITANSFPKFDYGDMVSVTGSLEKPVNFTDFDYITYLKKEGIRTTMFYPEIMSSDEDYNSLIYHGVGYFEEMKISLYRRIFSLKARFESAVNKSVSEPNAAFINGILLGSRQNIPDELKEAFNKTGVTHVLAISGYNIMIISWAVLTGLVYFFRRRTSFWISVVVIILFTILTGASASVVRASIMGLLILFANGYGRLYNPKNSIILAGAAMVWLNPLVLVFDVGFQLSFVAVLGLMYLYPRIDNKLKRIPKLGNLKEIFLMTLSAQIAVAPLLIYYFKNFSIVSLPTNVLILPFIPAAMLAGFISGLAGMVFLPLGLPAQAGQIAGWFAWAITTYQIEMVKLFAVIP
ncbi:MAG: ComEC/Rec2 family competence protein [Candidatus Yanofskybacteria bacterium]|nr:ComEC/Rec2 family competence protein [Candidatus Yanofskybacteria bacterium]